MDTEDHSSSGAPQGRATMICSHASTPAFRGRRDLLNAILVTIQFILAILVIVLILLHTGKDAGMASVTGFSFASSASVMERNLTRYTIIVGVLFFLNTFVLIWRLG
jgi:preprotein translocase subunit SecG